MAAACGAWQPSCCGVSLHRAWRKNERRYRNLLRCERKRDDPKSRFPPRKRAREDSEADELIRNPENVFKTKRQQSQSGKHDPDFYHSTKSFTALGVDDRIAAALRSLGYRRPSHIQALSYKHLAGRDSSATLLAGQAGSGKTLAYLLPLVERMRAEEERGEYSRQPGNPWGLVLVPTEELAQQVVNICRALSKAGVPFRSVAITGSAGNDTRRKMQTQLSFLKSETVDLVVATPGRLVSYLAMGVFDPNCLRATVFDEVDILVSEERGFIDQTKEIAAALPAESQKVLASATVPQQEMDAIQELFPGVRLISGPNLHRPSRRIKQHVIDCSPSDESDKEQETKNKLAALERDIAASNSPKVAVFCNAIEHCRMVENRLKRSDKGEKIRLVRPLHAAIRADLRAEHLDIVQRGDSSRQIILVATDRASRGLDLNSVDHIIMYDFPEHPTEFLRRAGRTARGADGAGGRMTALCSGPQVRIARQAMVSSSQRSPLLGLPRAS